MVNKNLLSVIIALIVIIVSGTIITYYYQNPATIEILDYSYSPHNSSHGNPPYYDIDFEINSNKLVDDVVVDLYFKQGDTVIFEALTHKFPPIGKGQYGYSFTLYNDLIPDGDFNNVVFDFKEKGKLIGSRTIYDLSKIHNE